MAAATAAAAFAAPAASAAPWLSALPVAGAVLEDAPARDSGGSVGRSLPACLSCSAVPCASTAASGRLPSAEGGGCDRWAAGRGPAAAAAAPAPAPPAGPLPLPLGPALAPRAPPRAGAAAVAKAVGFKEAAETASSARCSGGDQSQPQRSASCSSCRMIEELGCSRLRWATAARAVEPAPSTQHAASSDVRTRSEGSARRAARCPGCAARSDTTRRY